MKHLWAVLKKDFDGKKSGERIKLETEAEKKALVDGGWADDCADAETDALKKAVDDAAEQLTGTIEAKASAAITSALKSANDRIGKQSKFGVPAVARDHEVEALAGFKSQGEFFQCVAQAGRTNVVDKRLTDLLAKAPLGMNTLDGTDGGFLAPEAVASSVYEMAFGKDSLVARTDYEEISAPSMVYTAVKDASRATGSRRGGVRAYWLNQAATLTSSKPQMRQIRVTPHKLAVLTYVTDEQMSDTTGFALEQKLGQYAAEEIRFLTEDAIIRGTGAGQPMGILNAACLVSTTRTTASHIKYADLVNLYSRMLPSSVSRAVFFCNQDIMPDLLTMVDAGNNSIWLAGNYYPTASASPFGTIFGRPVIPIEYCSTLGTVGDLIFADLSMYKMCSRGGVKSASSIHVAFTTDEMAFKWTFRIDGTPWLDSAITQYKGSNTQSPFLAVAT